MKTYLLPIIFLLKLSVVISQTIVYVNINATGGLNNGTTWANAYTNLQTALDYVRINGESQIWVAKGTYKPSAYAYNISGSPTLTDRNFTFHLVNGIKMYGGFVGSETSVNERNKNNISVLSGDIGVLNNNSDNCYHVVLSINDNNTTLIDGFTISDGNYPNNTITVEGRIINTGGSGIYNAFSSLTITNVIISNNFSYDGGICNNNSAPNMTNIIISKNSGGGMVNFSSSPVINNGIFVENYGGTGGMTNYESSSPYLTNCLFYNNSTHNNGGGIANLYSSSPILKNCIFWENKKSENSSVIKSDIYNYDASTVFTATFCIFQLSNNSYTITNQNNITNGSGNLFAQSPLFLNFSNAIGNDGIWRTNDDGLRLVAGSVGINTGTNIGIVTNDIIGNIRPSNSGSTDIGPYELQEQLGSFTITPNSIQNTVGAISSNSKLIINNAIQIGNTSDAVAGTIRWTGADFEGYNGTQWKSLTEKSSQQAGYWQVITAGEAPFCNTGYIQAVDANGKVCNNGTGTEIHRSDSGGFVYKFYCNSAPINPLLTSVWCAKSN